MSRNVIFVLLCLSVAVSLIALGGPVQNLQKVQLDSTLVKAPMHRPIISGQEVLHALGVEPCITEHANQTGDLIWWVDTPQAGETVSGVVVISGWVLSQDGISAIDLYIGDDDTPVGTANLEIPRDDVIEHYPDYAYSPSSNPGFTIGFDAADYADDSDLTFYFVVTDANDVKQTIGTRTVHVDHDINNAPRGYLDHPMTGEVMGGSFPIMGWALDEDGLDRVDVLVDGLVVGGAVLDGLRPDVYHALSMFPLSGWSGFIYNLDTTRLTSDNHAIEVRAVDTMGMTRILAQRSIQVSNNSVNLEPFGLIDQPLRDATLWGCCDPTGICKLHSGGPSSPLVTIHPLNWVTGWALDVGAREDQGGVAYSELMVDGSLLANTRTDCFYDQGLMKDIDCYGLFRPDVQIYYPGYVDSPNAGFQFLLDVGDLIANWGYVEGSHHIAIRAGDYTDTVTNIDDIPVTWRCIDRAVTREAVGYIDHPISYEAVHGLIHLIGWAIDYDSITSIRIYVDGNLMGEADYGWERPDIYVNYEHSNIGLYSGWDYILDTSLFSDGEHDIVVEVLDYYENSSLIGERRIVVDNVGVK